MGFYEPERAETPENTRADRIDVSCLCWFYGDSKSLPVMVKFRGPGDEIITWKNISVRYSERKMYAGVLQVIYDCIAIVDDQKRLFKLSYYPNMSKWYMYSIQ